MFLRLELEQILELINNELLNKTDVKSDFVSDDILMTELGFDYALLCI